MLKGILLIMQDEDKNLFQEAVKNVKPLKIKSKTIEHLASPNQNQLQRNL